MTRAKIKFYKIGICACSRISARKERSETIWSLLKKIWICTSETNWCCWYLYLHIVILHKLKRFELMDSSYGFELWNHSVNDLMMISSFTSPIVHDAWMHWRVLLESIQSTHTYDVEFFLYICICSDLLRSEKLDWYLLARFFPKKGKRVPLWHHPRPQFRPVLIS